MAKTKRTPRYKWFFYNRISGTATDDRGRPVEEYVAVVSGMFAKEQARKPVEIIDASAITDESQYVLLGAWTPRYEQVIKSDAVAYCPAENKCYEVLSVPVDVTGEHRNTMIYVTDNIKRSVDTSALPMEYV